MAPPVAPSLVHGPPTPETLIPHGFPPTGGLVQAEIAGGSVSGLSGVGTQPWFGGTRITNNKVPVTPRCVTLPWTNERRTEATIWVLDNAGEVETLGNVNLTGRTTMGSHKGCNETNEGQNGGKL